MEGGNSVDRRAAPVYNPIMNEGGTFLMAMALTTLAGLSTTVGSLIGIFYKEPGPRYMAFTLGFSAGVMVLVSFVELLQQAILSVGFAQAHLAFFIGMFAMLLIDFLLPHSYILETHHGSVGHGGAGKAKTGRLQKASLMVAVGVGIHNFPEGMVTFAGTLKDVNIGIALAFAVAIHNIPEGIAVSVPIYASTGSRKKAFWWSFLSGASEPVGALLAGIVLMPFLSEALLGWMFAMVAGFMVFISFDELLPIAQSYGEAHVAIVGVMVGMMVMALSLAILI
ncbi:MAG: zinc transporter ZupT [Thermodesulfobacteriota bacterium]